MTERQPGSGHDSAEAEFFSEYAHIYAEPEVVWLSRVIAASGFPAGPDSIARVVLGAGYRRSGGSAARSGAEIGTRESSTGVACEPHRQAHDVRVCAVHQSLAESAGIYDLSDEEAAHFVRVFEALTGAGAEQS